ncbi:hypothetical protein [Pelagicoccus albus]|uniref:SMP-30/Gluconolaconase/LRE-like region-containing protein n=1 Tax=Pelagicoccus albus TaxID=415222 RepID=A0A7X1B807_9BACT|nr:hypothetical protein [Pelagicoccus albus]MBC2607347.1 hypothetical protein [Pelagicoccus albus]
MNTITEISRLKAPADLPQSLAWHADALWMGSLATKRIYQIDVETWTVKSEFPAPGNPFGMVSSGEELRVLCGETEEDNRFIRRLIPAHGFDTAFKIQCPDDTGSQLGFDGSSLHVSQWYNQVVLSLSPNGDVLETYRSPRGICGQVIIGDYIYIANTADEETNDYYLGRIDTKSGEYEDLANIPFQARALAHDGESFWTNHRAAGETVKFSL